MSKEPDDRYQSAREMLDAITEFKHNPSIKFEYEYMTTDAPARTINKIVNDNKPRAAVRTADARRAGQGTNHGKNGKNRKRNGTSRSRWCPSSSAWRWPLSSAPLSLST